MQPLYKLDNQIQTLISTADQTTGEISWEELDKLQISREEKVKSVIFAIKNTEANIEAVKTEVKRLKDMQATMERKSEWISNYLLQSMVLNGETELDLGIAKAKIRQNPPSVMIDDESLLPPKYVTQVISSKVDKVGLKAALKDGEVPGCHLETGTRLAIT